MSNHHPSLAASKVARRSITATNLFFRKQLWAWPLLAAVLLGGVGYGLRTSVERAVRASMEGQLQAILDADVAALRIWLEAQRSNAETAASAKLVGHLARELIDLAHQREFMPIVLAQSPQLAELRTAIQPWMDAHGFTDFIVVDREKQIVAASQAELIGRQELTRTAAFLDTVLAGQATVSRPFPSRILLTDEDGEVRVNLPTMFAVAPLRDDSDAVVGALALRLRPERDFTRILNVARFGHTGETYAFGPTGLLLSQSRFDDDLKRVGLLPDREDAHSILTLELRNPSVDMTKGARPKIRRSEQPLTKLAAEAIAGHSGVDVDGYRDYRGVPSLGAWTWLPEFGFGVGTEVDLAEAYRPTAILRLAYWGMFALLAVSTVAIFAFTVVVARLRRAMRQATVEAKQLGQYTLEEKLGEGGMGVVYRGRHARLQRPTAIKLLDVEKTTPESIRRFEREVQLTSQLNHANTVAIYDFGSTPEGVFYYAMEYLEGINLEQLVQK
ncbi:MAG TPA: protein kinase, partial [Pirellulales bacterium]|nr:protein kinase [Pirellulales bacterium]